MNDIHPSDREQFYVDYECIENSELQLKSLSTLYILTFLILSVLCPLSTLIEYIFYTHF